MSLPKGAHGANRSSFGTSSYMMADADGSTGNYPSYDHFEISL